MDPFVYQYAVGGVVFAIGLVYAARQGYIGFRGAQLRNLVILIGGLAFYMALQGYLQYAPMDSLPAVPFEGEPREPGRIGTTLDYGVMAAYFLAILAVGTWFGRRQKTLKDFFFGGQRFSWWLIAFSMIATLVGSYSFVKYGRVAYEYGLSSSQSYLNDWFWMPLLAFGWLPILYFSRVTSIPEYFERRFGSNVRLCATIIILTYLVSYVGVNLFTMGTVLNGLLGWDVLPAAILVACISAVYVTVGGQTSVIMTDLFQGVVLLAAGFVILLLGINHLGGFDMFWQPDDAASPKVVARRRLVDLIGEELDVESIGAPGPDPDSGVREQELRTALKASVDQLDEEELLLLTLRFEDERPVTEIMVSLGLPSKFHVYRRIKSVLAKLKKALEERGVEDPTP